MWPPMARLWWKRPTPSNVQDIRRAVTYFKENIPDIKGKRVGIMSRNCYEYGVNSFGAILAGAVVVTINQKKTWPELEYELGLVEPSLIVNDGIDYGCRPDIEAAYGDKLRPMDAFKDSAPAELVDCVGHDDLIGADVHFRHHRPQQPSCSRSATFLPRWSARSNSATPCWTISTSICPRTKTTS